MSIKSKIKKLILSTLNIQPEMKANILYSTPNNRLSGKKIIVTGGGRGLGLAMSKRFVEEGANVLISGRNEDKLRDVSNSLGCQYLCLDVQDTEKISSFIAEADAMLGGVNCLVNNAGISLHEGGILDVSESNFDDQIHTYLRGAYFLTQEFIKIVEGRSACDKNVLFVSSERGVFVDDLPYGLTKAAINSLVQGLAYRYIQKGIRFNAIAPGVTTSDMTGYKEDENLYCGYNMTKRVYLPNEVAEVASFLLSDVARCLNGQILVLNEGKSINFKR